MVNINYNDNDSQEKVTIDNKYNYFLNKQRFYCFRFIGAYWRIIYLIIIQKGIQKIFQNFSNNLWLPPKEILFLFSWKRKSSYNRMSNVVF